MIKSQTSKIYPAALFRYLCFTLLFILAFALPLLVSSLNAAELNVDQHASRQSLTALSEYVETEQEMSFDEVLALPADRWQASPGHNFNRGYSASSFWFRITLRNQTNQDLERLIQLDRPFVDEFDIYLIQRTDGRMKLMKEYHLGDWRPNQNRVINQQVAALPLTLKANSEFDLYVRAYNHGAAAHYIMTLWKVADFYDNKFSDDLINLLYLGGALILAIYNLFILFSLRQISYAYYCGYILSFSYIVASLLGYPQWLSADHLIAYHQYGFLVAITALRLFLYLFTINFLRLSSRTPRLVIVFTVLLLLESAVGVALIVSLFVHNYELFSLVYGFTGKLYPVHGIVALLTGIYLWAKGVREARFFTLALSLFTLTIVVNALSLSGYIAFSKDVLRFLQLGQLFEMLLLSFALADKINIARETEKQLGETKQQLFESELHSVEEQYKAEKAELASQAKSQFLASMSHEIRTPMNAILGYAQLLMMDRQINPEQRQQLEIINRSGDHLLGLINDVLDMAKIESAQITMNPSDCDLYALIDDVMAMVMVRAEDKGLSLELQLDEDLPRFVHLDGAKLRQILINLIGNAIKFTEFGGISISAGLKSHAFGSDVAKIYFDIEDTGAGIAEEERDKVFSQFEQTSSGINEGGGTGLGMPISLEFCRLMGGDLTFTSVVNQGSVFTVVVEAPMAHNAIDNMSHRHKQVVGIKSVKGGKALHELKVLIVDDIASNRNLLAALIQPLGLNCSFAGNGEESITRFLSDKPDLIMMDLRMPKLGGLDAIKRIRSHSKGHDVAIIVVSASAFEADRIDIMEAGADAFLRKPFKTHRVYRMVQKYLGLEYEYAEDESPQAHLQEDADVQGEPRSHSASADSSVSAPEGIAPINTKQGLHLVTEAPLSGCKEYNMEDEQAKDFRILVVDDNDVNIMLCQKQLETLGYESDAAENGQQAVERYQQQAYSLILMDYEMPVMGGLLAAQHIRQWEQEKGLSACTIIGLSAHKGEHEAEALSAGMDEFLSKPLRVVDLKEVLTRYLSQREAL